MLTADQIDAAVERFGHLDSASWLDAAAYAARSLRERGHAHVVFGPGDSTEYRFAIMGPGPYWLYDDESACTPGNDLIVSLAGFGGTYWWNPRNYTDPLYAVQRWTRPESGEGTRYWTALVVSAFLNALAYELNKEAP